MTKEISEAAVDDPILDVVRALGLFEVNDLAELMGQDKLAIEHYLEGSIHVERVAGRDGLWRLCPTEVRESLKLDQAVAESLTQKAEATVRALEGGKVLGLEARTFAIDVAMRRLDRAISASEREQIFYNRIQNIRTRLERLRNLTEGLPDEFILTLLDWTVGLPVLPNSQAGTFDIEGVLAAAKKQAADPRSVFAPARAAVATGFAESNARDDIIDFIDTKIRAAALRNDVTTVLSLGCVAAVCGLGRAADALLAALTTRMFGGAVDRSTRRIAYIALSNLARPGACDGQLAADACYYLMRREKPGQDEIELLGPAALQASATDTHQVLVLTAQWLKWERDRGGASVEQFGHVARNLGCSLDSYQYEQLNRAIPALAEEEAGRVLVRHLSNQRHHAIRIFTVRSSADNESLWDWNGVGDGVPEHSNQFVVSPREQVASVTTSSAGSRTPLEIKLGTRMAEAIIELREEESTPPPGEFAKRLRARSSL